MARDAVGPLEREVLQVLISTPQDAYGLSVAERLKAATGRDLSPGAVYTTLERLEQKGFVTSSWGDPTGVRGGRRKRMYVITAQGRMATRAVSAEKKAVAVGLGAALPQGA